MWDEKLNRPETCERTPIFPFRVGCPPSSSCGALRQDVQNQTGPFYRTALMFYFGQADKYPLGGPMPPQTAYDTGIINFQCSQELVHNFVEATHSLQLQSQQTFGTRIRLDKVPEMHMSLMYLCCLTKDEAMMANQLFWKWSMERYPFDLSLRFDRTECWQVRRNVVGIMLVGDDKTQAQFMQLNHEVRNLLQANDIPVVIPRESQMKFHISLMGLKTMTSNKANSSTQVDYILPYLDDIHKLTLAISEHYMDRWTKGRMRVTHWLWPGNVLPM